MGILQLKLKFEKHKLRTSKTITLQNHRTTITSKINHTKSKLRYKK